MKTINITLKNTDLESLFFAGLKLAATTLVLLMALSCSSDEDCAYTSFEEKDCENLNLNIGDTCSINNDGNLDGVVNEFCECLEEVVIPRVCPGFIQNGDFEITTGDPNTQTDQDIDLATNWKALWQSGSLADLFNNTSTSFGSSSFVAPTPASGVFSAMWIENSPGSNSTYREGMFNELSATINANTGIYTLSFDYANMSASIPSNAVKVGVYGVYFPSTATLPANPTGNSTPTNIDLFGAANTVFLGEVTIASTATNTWSVANFTINTNTLAMPASGIDHIMITNSHLALPDYGKMFVGFDNFCLTD